jgi:hypothetical protein
MIVTALGVDLEGSRAVLTFGTCAMTLPVAGEWLEDQDVGAGRKSALAQCTSLREVRSGILGESM